LRFFHPNTPCDKNRIQIAENRKQMTDTGNQITWIANSRALLIILSSIERCPAPCALPFPDFPPGRMPLWLPARRGRRPHSKFLFTTFRLPPSQFLIHKIISFSQNCDPKSFFPAFRIPNSDLFYMPYALFIRNS
jgi:hypothetical protein